MQIKKRWIIVLLSGLVLMGCGGGSGGKNSSFDTSGNSPVIEDVVLLDKNSTEEERNLYYVEQNETDIVAYVRENTAKAFQVKGKDKSSFFYSLSRGDSFFCQIDPLTGDIVFNETTDYEKKSIYRFDVVLSDMAGNRTIKGVTIYVRDEKNEHIIVATDVNSSLPIDSEQKYFITKWRVNSDNDYKLTIPTLGDGYNYSVDWGDGNSSTNVTTRVTHTYNKEDIYTVKITGDFPRIKINKVYAEFDTDTGKMEIKTDFDKSNSKLLSIEQWGTIKWKSMRFAFANTRIKINATDNPDLSHVTDMTGMFMDLCGEIHPYTRAPCGYVDLNGWDVSHVTNMSMMFDYADFEPNISEWDVSHVTNMSSMFIGGGRYETTAVNPDVSKWDVSKVTDMSKMFAGNTYFNGDIGMWNVSNVKDMSEMFRGWSAYHPTIFNQDIGNWDVSKVKNMHNMFSTCEFNQNIGNWNVSSVTDMSGMFSGDGWAKSPFNQDISRWDVSKVKNMSYMFNMNNAFNQNLEHWSVANDVNTSRMFENATALEVIPSWYKEGE